MSAQPTPALDSHADKIAEIHRLRDMVSASVAETKRLRAIRDGLLAALEALSDAVGGMRVPQTIEDAGLQVFVTIGPALERAHAAIAAAKGETFATGQARQGVAP